MKRLFLHCLFCLAVSALAAGCAKHISPAFPDSLPPELVSEKNYILNVEQVASVGESVVRVKEYVNMNTLTLEFEPSGDCYIGVEHDPVFIAKKGTPIKAVGCIIEKGQAYYLLQSHHYKALIPVTETGEYLGGFAMRVVGGLYSGNDVSFSAKGDFATTPPGIVFERVVESKIDTDAGYSNYEIIFTGVSDDAINFLYREYTAQDIARVAFYQNLTYPTDSKYIKFKSMKIAIHSIDEQGLHYKVLAE